MKRGRIPLPLLVGLLHTPSLGLGSPSLAQSSVPDVPPRHHSPESIISPVSGLGRQIDVNWIGPLSRYPKHRTGIGGGPETNIVWEFHAEVFWWSKSIDTRLKDGPIPALNLSWDLYSVWNPLATRIGVGR